MIGRLANQEDGRDENVCTLSNQFRLFDTSVVVSSDRSLQTVLLERRNRNQDHVGARQQIAHFRPGHVRQEVLYFLLGPQRIRLRADRGRHAHGQDEDRRDRVLLSKLVREEGDVGRRAVG